MLGLTLVKFGNAVLLEKLITRPNGGFEWLLNSWPLNIAYVVLLFVAFAGFAVANWKTSAPTALALLPLAWLAWEILATTQSQSMQISMPTLLHFAACVLCFYLGLLSLGPNCVPRAFWPGIILGFSIAVASGLHQHFGGLEEARRYWETYIYPTLTVFPPGLIKKMHSDRVFGTLFYPNTLAQVILMLLPPVLCAIWSAGRLFTAAARAFLMAVPALGALGCLYWTGSKGGWLIMLITAVVGSFFLPVKNSVRLTAISLVLVAGLSGFTIKHLAYFKKGAPSAEARFDYWRAAVQTTLENPLFGTGPGTFAQAYEKRKKPESEMARLTHNDYLQQASDSGIPAALLYAIMVVGTLAWTFRHARLREDWVRLGVWLGLLGWALQSLMEFGLYIPAVGWVAFALMGWLLSQTKKQCAPFPVTT